MAVKVSERVHVMKEEFMTLHNQGYTIPEIAQKYGLSGVTVYRHLGEIASANGVMRDDLLKVVKTPTSEAAWRRKHEETKIKFEELEEAIKKTKDTTQNILNEINNILEINGEEER